MSIRFYFLITDSEKLAKKIEITAVKQTVPVQGVANIVKRGLRTNVAMNTK